MRNREGINKRWPVRGRHFNQMDKMLVDLVWLSALVLFLPVVSQCEPLYVLSAPNLLRVGSKENVFVEEATGLQKVSLNSANKFQALQEIQLAENFFEKESHLQQHVYLEAKFGQREVTKVILVSFQSGYIFVQTDKTIYTPESTVQYRVFALNPGLEPITRVVSVEVMTPDGITVQKDDVKLENGVISKQFLLPEIVSVGIWKLVCRFQNTPQKNFTADFEVKEYVLPSFEVKLTPEQSFFYVDDKDLTVEITARYLYGEDVAGMAFAVFGRLTDAGEKKSFPASLQRVPIEAGKGKVKLTREQIQKTYPKIRELIQQSLYVSVSVLTHSGSEMVEAEKRGILVVTSPYTIHFTKTPTYFKPGMPFQILVYVTNPDDTPAEDIDIEVTPGPVVGKTQKNGMAKLTINTKGSDSSLPITVRTKSPALTPGRQASAHMTAKPYKTLGGSKNYLHISIQVAELEIGDNLQINLNPGNSPGLQGQDKDKDSHSLDLEGKVTKDMIPSFRFVAYYHVGIEVVSDSVWVDVKDTCMGMLEVTSSKPKDVYEPRKPISLTITGDPGARVGLVAVDKGVYVLNSKNRLTQTKIWDIVEKHDIGCTPGSGADSMGVFYDAGLAFESIAPSAPNAVGTPSRPNFDCPVLKKNRRRRSLALTELKSSLASNYTGLEKQCCKDGMAENILELTCDVDDDYFSDTDIVSRTQFPESWLWEEVSLPVCNDKLGCKSTSTTKNSFMKDSITTWEITAVSLSRTHGICVSEPYEMKVMKNFFIDLKLPYAAVRNEQLEIKAVLYNYNDEGIMVRVELMETEHVCSAASKQRKYRVPEVFVDSMSSRAVPFVIIPMALGLHSIEVKASVYGSIQTDGVKKDLRVVPEGLKTTKAGEVLSQTIQAAISGKPMGSLIHQPGGCGEQNMIRVTGPVIATHYLDKTGQWEQVGPDRRAQAIKFIQMGYMQQLAYRSPEGGFSVWQKKVRALGGQFLIISVPSHDCE
ncbi:hypothetical protein GJAV_G00265890 [Gymnothorax javanicus]|nr:hypothetical protein GJAV_G00265890 [Gymnothorax javanicus]